jgi:hypothetical protein
MLAMGLTATGRLCVMTRASRTASRAAQCFSIETGGELGPASFIRVGKPLSHRWGRVVGRSRVQDTVSSPSLPMTWGLPGPSN